MKGKGFLTFLSFSILISTLMNPNCVHGQLFDLVAFWDFNELSGLNLLDKSGNNNNGFVFGTTLVESPNGYALAFDGSIDRVEIDASSSFEALSYNFKGSATGELFSLPSVVPVFVSLRLLLFFENPLELIVLLSSDAVFPPDSIVLILSAR